MIKRIDGKKQRVEGSLFVSGRTSDDIILVETKLSSSTQPTTNQNAVKKAIQNGESLEIRTQNRILWFDSPYKTAIGQKIKFSSSKKAYSSTGTAEGGINLN